MEPFDDKFKGEILQKYRKILFPAIGEKFITGYNIYVDRFSSDAPYVVSYLHSDLGFHEDGTPHRHRKELADVISEFAQVNIREKIVGSITDRIATYKIGDWEENPKDLIFYVLTGSIILPEKLPNYEGIVIAEGKQFDLSIEIENRADLHHLLGCFNKHVYATKTNSRGEVKFGTHNVHAIYGSWEIPLIIMTGDNAGRRDFRAVTEIQINEQHHEISTIVRKQRKSFEAFLKERNVIYDKTRKFANRPFVELYLDRIE